jgi:hypothetical protein
VADVLFLAVSKEKQYLTKNLEDSRQCELAWRLLRPAVQALTANPRNDLGDWTVEQLLEPKLLPFSGLAPQLQEKWLPAWVLVDMAILNKRGPARAAAVAAAAKELRKEIPDIEVYVYPSVQLEFWLDGKRQFADGVGRIENYGWLMRRTR